ncbi:phage virion morphogenesis protein [Chromohalobacter marismortui]|uniref:Phage virion morphogenesis protein n=1 Tax=Chromohalobacter marismortui TaxID=42055 RepID=A0A4V3F592_9GAMM|nr:MULTISPECIES: phage virion morphogenesis protein [Chromohalobacter]MCI0508607.1 phage virion morphogenesis protein [Chromohalobacter sp.]TDU23086.1 phage virion morphogenesis protein [Chromohalobacter marismortui]
MTDDLQALEDWAAPLLAQLEAKERRRLARAIARDLRRSQRQRIRSQTNPDGTPYAPRQPQKWRARQGSIRRSAMFDKLSTAKWLKATTHGDTAVVGFMGNVARIARTHQYGLRDRVDRDGPTIEYPQRELLGFTDADRELVINALFTHLGSV